MPFVERGDRPVSAILAAGQSSLMFTNTGVHLASADGVLRFHLGTAFIRLLAFARGELDPLLRAAEAVPGDRVLDTTFGLGRDARVIARAVGTSGHVVGLESSPALFHLATQGLQHPDQSAELDGLSAPVELILADAPSYLEACEANDFDTVLVDPMFETPATSDRGFELLRAVADPTPLTEGWVHAARRVARRWVVVKASNSQPWFSSQELEWVPSNSNAGWYRAPATT